MVYMNRGEGGRAGDRPVAYKATNDRISRSYRSPPLTARVQASSSGATRYASNNNSNNVNYEEHRSRRDEELLSSSTCLSKFYRERFGSHSPEDYLNLRLSQFDRNLTKESIRSSLEREFKALTPFEIKIVQNPDSDDRLAYVNFERPECAKIVRRNMIPRLQKVLGRRIVLDPAGVIRDQEGKFIPDRYNRQAMAAAVDRARSPRAQPLRRRQSPTSSGTHSIVNSNSLNGIATPMGRRRENGFTNLNQDDTQASRTIFVGNLPGDVRETELRRIFEIFGTIDNIDIKILQDSNAAFAFILYRTVEEAIEARGCQHNKPIRPGSSRCQIGYGKSQQSQRLYVGGLGSWCSYDLLMSEFDRCGSIDMIEFEPGENFAYVRFETVDSSVEACARMKHYDLSGKGNHITVDFAKDDKRRKRLHSGSDDEFDSKRRGDAHTPSLSPGRSPTEAGYIQTLDELRDQIASTWKGIVTLKKAEYPLSLYRVFGKEHMVQDWLRDEQGNSLRLNIIQRLPIDVDYYKRTIELTKSELALMIAVEGSQPAEPLVAYLKEKNAAGVVSIQGGRASVHVLAHSAIAERLIKFFAPRIALLKPNSNYLLIALKKNIGVISQGSAPSAAPPPPEPTHLPPPPPLPFLGSLGMVKREVEEVTRMPLREDRPAIQMQLKMKQEISELPTSSTSSMISFSALSGPAPPPPIPPELSPPRRNANSANKMKESRAAFNNGKIQEKNVGSDSSSEGENEHRRPPAQQQHHHQINQRRHRKDDEVEEEEEEPSSDEEMDIKEEMNEDNRVSSRCNEKAAARSGDKNETDEEGRASDESDNDN